MISPARVELEEVWRRGRGEWERVRGRRRERRERMVEGCMVGRWGGGGILGLEMGEEDKIFEEHDGLRSFILLAIRAFLVLRLETMMVEY